MWMRCPRACLSSPAADAVPAPAPILRVALPGLVDEDAAARMLKLMSDIGGDDLVGDVDALPEGLFVQPRS